MYIVFLINAGGGAALYRMPHCVGYQPYVHRAAKISKKSQIFQKFTNWHQTKLIGQHAFNWADGLIGQLYIIGQLTFNWAGSINWAGDLIGQAILIGQATLIGQAVFNWEGGFNWAG